MNGLQLKCMISTIHQLCTHRTIRRRVGLFMVLWVGALGYFSRGLRLRKRRPGGTFTVGGAPAPRVTAQGIRTNYTMGPRKRFIEFCYDTCLRFSVCTHFGNPAARAAATGNNDTRLSLGSSSPVRQLRERHLT